MMFTNAVSRFFAAIFLLGFLSSCSSPGPFTRALEDHQKGPVKSGHAGMPAGTAELEADGVDVPVTSSPLETVVEGTGEFLASAEGVRRSGPSATENLVELNFLGAEVEDVLRVLLGDLLKLNYVVDPEVQGTITLQSSNPVPRADVFALLDEALGLNGLTIIESGGIYSIIQEQDAQRRIRALRRTTTRGLVPQGYGIWAVPLSFVSAVEMQKILEPFAPQGNVVRVDNARNLLLIAGTQQEIESLLDTISVFDVDWMKGMSFGLFELTFVDADTVSGELQEILNAPGSPMRDLVRIIPLPRLNAVLVMSPRREYLGQAQQWIQRLDRGRDKVSRRIFVYHVQNGRADDLVTSLGGILGDGDFEAPAPEPEVFDPPPLLTEDIEPGAAEQPQLPQSDRQSAAPVGFENNGMRLFADNKNNAILLFATANEYESVLSALHQLDTPPLQVLIEATIVEVGLNEDLDYGVEWFFQTGKNRFDFSQGGEPTSVFPGFSYGFLATDVEVVVNALDSVTDIDVLSSPQLMVVNNETARLQVGDEVPVPTQSAVSVTDPDSPIVNSIQFKDSGIILVITPRINNNGSVYLEVTQEASIVVPNVTSGIDAPTFQQRKISSTVVVDDGETIALGGLIRSQRTITNAGVPVLKDIPLVGLAFKSRTDTQRRTELLVFLTPHVVRSASDARATTDYLRQKLEDAIPQPPWGIPFLSPFD